MATLAALAASSAMVASMVATRLSSLASLAGPAALVAAHWAALVSCLRLEPKCLQECNHIKRTNTTDMPKIGDPVKLRKSLRN